MTVHSHKRRRSGNGPVHRALWSCWCSCGWVCPDLTRDPHGKFQQHLREAASADMDRLMRQTPSRRG